MRGKQRLRVVVHVRATFIVAMLIIASLTWPVQATQAVGNFANGLIADRAETRAEVVPG